MVPDRNFDGQIEAIQVRLDRVYNQKFYNLTSVDKYYGTPARCCPHYVGVQEGDEVVCVTEGVMKADLAYHFALGSQYECGFAGLTGVPSYSQYERLLQELSELGVQRLNIMIDSDYQDNDKVRTARYRYIELGAEAGFEVAPITWSRRQKGIDDLYKPYSPVYLKTLHNQLSAVFNHAVRHYNLKVNPAAQAGNMGKPKGREMLFWTKAEYLKFAEAMMDKPLSYYAFEMLYWCGVREGELLALTPGDFDFEKQTVTISKSYQRIKGKDVITDPKTPKSNRVIQMPAFLCEEMRDYIKSLYGVKPTDRIFTVTKSYLHREMDRGAKEAGVKRIRIHDLRHSHISLLIDMGFTALAIADRVGHESIDITYRYAHLFPTRQTEMADKLDMERKGA